MVMPLAARVVAAVIGGLLVLTAASSVTGTLIVSRSISSRLTRWVDKTVVGAYRLVFKWYVHKEPGDSPHAIQMAYKRADRLLATQPAAILLGQLATWLVVAYVGFALLLWPFATHGVVSAFIDAGSSLFTLGFAVPAGAVPAVIVFLAAATGLVIVTLQIAYLPTLYAAFNRRETEVALLNARAGVPSWGPELLARTHYALGTGMSTLDTMPDLYAQWERWAADVAESHSNYPVLVRFRSPHPLDSWLVGLLSVMDSAAMLLALCPSRDRIEPRRAIRMGFTALREIGSAVGMDVDMDPDPDSDVELSFEEFSAAVDQLRTVDFPVERDAAEAWPHFRGWRVNYESLAYALAYRTNQVPAPWSGPRRWGTGTIPVQRPTLRLPGKSTWMKEGKVVEPDTTPDQADRPAGAPTDGVGETSRARND